MRKTKNKKIKNKNLFQFGGHLLDEVDEVVVDGLCRLDREEGGGREPDGGIHALASEEGDGTDARVDDDAFTVGCLRREDYAASAAYVGGLDVLGLLDQLFKVGG